MIASSSRFMSDLVARDDLKLKKNKVPKRRFQVQTKIPKEVPKTVPKHTYIYIYTQMHR